jgi:hypothetical protein
MAVSQGTESHTDARAETSYGSEDKLVGTEISEASKDQILWDLACQSEECMFSSNMGSHEKFKVTNEFT